MRPTARRRMWVAGLVAVAFLALPVAPARALPLFQFSSTTLTFPDTSVGVTSAAIDVTVTNLSGSSQVLSSVAGGAPADSTNFGATQNCAGVTLAAGGSCSFSYTFHPTAVGPFSTTSSFSVNGESSGTITLSGTAVDAFTIAPTTLSFPDTSVGVTSAALDVTVTNVSGASLLLSSVAGGAPSDGTNFGATQNCAGVTLAAGASCAFSYTFHPTALGALSTTTSFSVNGQSSGTISLSGTGVPVFTITPTTLAFPDTAVGATSAAMDVTVTNVSGAPQVLSSVAGGAPSDGTNFGAVQNCAGVTLAAGASCAFSYTFHPTTAGAHSTTTSFSINGQSSGTVTLSGTAVPAFTITPTTLTFPDTTAGSTSAAIDVVVTNVSGAPQVLSSVAGGAPGDSTNFGAVQNCAGVTLAAGASCAFSYTFHPAADGIYSTTTSFTVNGQSSGTITLSGSTPGATPSPTPTPTATTSASASATLADTGSPVGQLPWLAAIMLLVSGVALAGVRMRSAR